MLKRLIFNTIVATLTFATPSLALPLSPGDRVKVTIPEGAEFSGIFEVNLEGNLEIPYLTPLPVVGLEPEQVEENLTTVLIDGAFFQPSFLQVSLKVVQWGPVEVFVSGATFLPGRVFINEPSPGEKTQPPVPVAGQYPPNRYLAAAIRDAGGVKPTADIKNIQLIRDKKTRIIDLSGLFTGEPFVDLPLIAGDRIIVPDSGQMNNELVRPSPITPTGVKVFLSNLTVPATGNASSGVGRDATSFPYGARFSHAVVAANCAGGTRGTNAERKAILVTTEQLTGKTTYLQRHINDLLTNSTSDANNPFLQANDIVTCYDSKVVQFRDIIQTILSPIPILRDLLK
ncbi:polysaccharide export protein [Anabaena cylindrica FACHB-243]|uniref:Polysaccharide export protein n=1 Tax=Anabaena cylindrica (strain ATCC 27899 / PCC 7122) TaxID=272123 RepID=K9ZIP3_ANACC|nr:MULTISPECIES: polysaccharide biosynthesis/export family protein [Anabaena]AFZ58634.1 polysaccharide export protein [Anabaena cylindrica PCC 7122]MBD2419979.1 polysaccharide export protein [Anabaena cylindrica FACHB-243]MBY5282887.1 polysaccharide export protein [Anabaena sp. CCAP 1446/1C]MBY5310403.1 polysaccharide export protein [Anabaena sp. CCAP 1446/1C]MCM2407127.1 polysaccharide export protein [Anabaena sp. CCAP 1446/1C]